MPFEAFKPVFKALPKLGFVGLAPALVITQCPMQYQNKQICVLQKCVKVNLLKRLMVTL